MYLVGVCCLQMHGTRICHPSDLPTVVWCGDASHAFKPAHSCYPSPHLYQFTDLQPLSPLHASVWAAHARPQQNILRTPLATILTNDSHSPGCACTHTFGVQPHSAAGHFSDAQTDDSACSPLSRPSFPLQDEASLEVSCHPSASAASGTGPPHQPHPAGGSGLYTHAYGGNSASLRLSSLYGAPPTASGTHTPSSSLYGTGAMHGPGRVARGDPIMEEVRNRRQSM